MRRRLAILIGNQSFLPESGLLPLQGPPNDVAAMARLLGDPERGNFVVRTLLDRPHHEITRLIEEELGNRGENELVLIYYSGHGKPDIRGRLCLATADTREKTLLTTSIGAQHLLDIVEASFHRQVVIILDCCYSARIGDKGDPSAELQDKARETSGLFILTSSDKQQISREETVGQGGEVMGVFTSALLRCVQSEAAVNEGGEIRLRALLPQLEKDRDLARQKPKFFAHDASGDPLICRYSGFTKKVLDPRLLADLTDPKWHRRLGAVGGLGTIVQEGTPAQRNAARQILELRLDLGRPDHEQHFDVRMAIERHLAGYSIHGKANGGITAGLGIEAGGHIEAYGEINAGAGIKAGGSIPAGLGIEVALSNYTIPASASDAPPAAVFAYPTSLAKPSYPAPAWADHVGHDKSGPWASFTLRGQVGQKLTQRLRWIPPGRFRMGSPPDELGRNDWEGPQHDVTISTGFWLFDTPVTQALWQAVMGDNPSRFKDPQRPVESVSYYDVQKFLAKANTTPWGRGLVLPSEAQWEYACRAGSIFSTYYYANSQINGRDVDAIAWHSGNSCDDFDLPNCFDNSNWIKKLYSHKGAGTRKAAQKLANAWGLYDMLGNVWECCADGWHDSYKGAPADGSAWVDGAYDFAVYRVVRGGSWNTDARYVRSARRDRDNDQDPSCLGFRCARALA